MQIRYKVHCAPGHAFGGRRSVYGTPLIKKLTRLPNTITVSIRRRGVGLALVLRTMGSYRLRRVLKSTDGGGGTAYDSRTIEAANLDAAIAAAMNDRPAAPDQKVESAVLSTLSGEIVWTCAPSAPRPAPSC